MAANDLMEELKLHDFYPQKLSFREAIKLLGKSQNGCPKKYGLEIVRKLLMFDSMAVVSVTTEINERLNNAELSQRKLHPMDLLVVVMNCCDDFLRQVLVEKMFANKLSIPILLPDVRNGSFTLLLLALRSLVPEVQDQIRENSSSLTDTFVDIRKPVVSFIRVGKLHRSKSKLLNELLSFNSFNTFFHRESSNGFAKRLVSIGTIEAAWFQSSTATEEEFNCRFFTALNLRGNAKNYRKQTQFLCQSSTLVVFMVDSFESFKDLYENALKNVDLSQTKIIVCYISPESPNEVDETNFELWNDSSGHGVISTVKYDWNHGEKINDVDFTNDLRKTISKMLKPQHGHSNQMPTYANFSRNGANLGFHLDEDNSEYKLGKASADDFISLVLKEAPDIKPIILPLQGKPWVKIGVLEREQRRKPQNKSMDEHFIAEKETEKRRQRKKQCRSLIQQSEICQTFSLKFHNLQDRNLLYYLNSCRIKLDARSRVIILNIIKEYKKEKEGNHPKKMESEFKLKERELKTANRAISLEHILRELGQMYEAVIAEEIRMRDELKKAPLTVDIIRNFPSIVAELLLTGQPLELMDGDASNVPITWLKAVLNQVTLMTNNAKVFVLSIIGVQSSGKSTLLNALFGLQCPVSAGRCTKGIYCHLVPVDKESLHTEYDYVLVVDTEGLGASEFAGKSTFRDNELATFAIGLADATIINMKGENWAEMKDILQIVAYGLIRVRKTKAELDLMPRCMFVHQNVPATDAEEKNCMDQEKQLLLLDEATEAAARAEGFTEITKFNQVIRYDSSSHSYYFPDLWNGSPPKARISHDYTVKVDILRHHITQLMNGNPSNLTISSFFHRMSDLWNAMLHNDFVLCFRNTQEIISITILNDRISHEVDRFKNLNKLEQKKIRELICFGAEKGRILREVSDTVEKNFENMKATLQTVIDDTNLSADSKQKYELSLNALKDGELRRVSAETTKDISVQMQKLEIDNDQRVKDVKAKLSDLEKSIEEVGKDNLNETEVREFEERWNHLTSEKNMLVAEKIKIIENEISETIRVSIQNLNPNDTVQLNTVDWSKIFKTPLAIEMPQVTEDDIVQIEKANALPSWVMDFVHSKSYVLKVNSRLEEARKIWETQFQNQRDQGFNASQWEQIMSEVGQLLGISGKEHEVRPETDEICLVLPPGHRFTRDYIIKFIKFACHYTYNRSLENSKRFISMTDPLTDIDERRQRSIRNLRLGSAEENIAALSKQIFNYAQRYFVQELGELIKTEVCKKDNKNPTFKSKRAFLRTILTDLGQKAHNLTQVNEEKQRLLKEFMLYVELAESEDSENFFLNVIVKLLKEMLTRECENASETDFQKMVENNVGRIIKEAKDAMRHADANCNGCAREYVRIFKDCMTLRNEIDFRVSILEGFTEAVVNKVDSLFADFLIQANSSFETLVGEDNKAAILPLFEKVMGCREKCPFCSAPCSQSLEKHAGYHRANHYPTGVSGTVDIWGLFANIQETNDATEERHRKRGKLSLHTCQILVGTRVDFRTKATVQECNKWYHRLFKLNYHSFKNYKEIAEYKNWDIPYSQDHNISLYWKWFTALFDKELAKHYKALCPEIPPAWRDVTWDEARKSLDEPDEFSQFNARSRDFRRRNVFKSALKCLLHKCC